MFKRWKTKDKTTNEDNVGKTRSLSLMKTLIETLTIAHGIQYQLILLDSLSLFNKCLNTSCGLGNSRDPNTLSDRLRDYFCLKLQLGRTPLLRPLIVFCNTWTLSCSCVPTAQSRCGALRIEACGWPTNIAKHVNENKRKIASSLP